jgi:nicotinate phosphoribosyltransferase
MMAIFNGKRLTQQQLKLDIKGLQRGIYTDKYFDNVARVLAALSATEYRFHGTPSRPLPVESTDIEVGDLIVEAQVFNRRVPRVLVGGVDAVLTILRHATGYFEESNFISTWQNLEVLAVEDGTFTEYGGNPLDVQPVLKIRGRYRDFALLETPILGMLTRISRIATNVYNVMEVTNGKPVLFFPARFDLPEVQSADGYAYWLAVQRYNYDTGQNILPSVSTDAQAAWWNGRGGGTVPHALIACFFGDSAESMVAFAQHMPITTPRILLADFNNDATEESRKTLKAYWQRYREALKTGDVSEQKRWTLNGVRLDTSASLVDAALTDPKDRGVSAALVRAVRQAIDTACEDWGETGDMLQTAREYCRHVQIVVTGGFNRERIMQFEQERVPVDIYGVGSTFLQNDSETNTDYTMDIVRILVHGEWVDMAKVGRQAGENPQLKQVNLAEV